MEKKSPKKGYKHTEEHRQKISKTLSGRQLAEEHKKKISEEHLGKRLGKRHTEESKQKSREAQLGRKHTEESKQKMSKAQLGKQRTEEFKQKISKARLGKPFTKEHKQNISKGHWKGGSELSQAREEEKHRGFGFIPLNDNFIGAEAHHLDKELILYIPKELHKSVYHNQFTGQGMEEMNNLACEYVYGIKTEE